MKRLFFTLLLFPILTCMTSCLDSDSDDTPTITPEELMEMFAESMYASLERQNSVIAIDPTYIAFRFNMLMATAIDQGVDFDEATYRIQDEKGEWYDLPLIDYLFDEFDLIEQPDPTQPWIWTITYNGTSYAQGSFDQRRRGKITIDTHIPSDIPNPTRADANDIFGGTLLEDLREGESWQFSFSSSYEGGDAYYRLMHAYSTDYLYFEDYVLTSMLTPEYPSTDKEHPDQVRLWKITGNSKAYKDGYKEGQGDWNFEFFLRKEGNPNQTYDNVMGENRDDKNGNTLKYSIWGNGSGYACNLLMLCTSEVKEEDPIKIRPGFNHRARFSGQEVIELDKEDYEDSSTIDPNNPYESTLAERQVTARFEGQYTLDASGKGNHIISNTIYLDYMGNTYEKSMSYFENWGNN